MTIVKSPVVPDRQMFGYIVFLPLTTIRRDVGSELPLHYAPQSMTSLARRSTDGGTVKSRSLATLRFTIRSNLDACSTGRSPGLAPLSKRSTYEAARCCK